MRRLLVLICVPSVFFAICSVTALAQESVLDGTYVGSCRQGSLVVTQITVQASPQILEMSYRYSNSDFTGTLAFYNGSGGTKQFDKATYRQFVNMTSATSLMAGTHSTDKIDQDLISLSKRGTILHVRKSLDGRVEWNCNLQQTN